jgi:DNA-binding transcriptional ArsR family regulator
MPNPSRRRSARPASPTRRQLTQQLRALAHPLRLRLLEAFAQGPRTTMQVASRLGEPPTRLYHHVNALERAGLLKLVDTKAVRGTTEKYFELSQKRIGAVSRRQLTPASRSSVAQLATSVFDQARRELLAAVAGPTSLTSTTAPTAFRMILALPPSRIATVRRRLLTMLRQIKKDCSDWKKKARGELAPWALTLALAPTLSQERPAGSGRNGPRTGARPRRRR